jgi:hypothetical protein
VAMVDAAFINVHERFRWNIAHRFLP